MENQMLAYFEGNPTVEGLFFTKDGQGFFERHFAEAHAKTLGSEEPEWVENPLLGGKFKSAKTSTAKTGNKKTTTKKDQSGEAEVPEGAESKGEGEAGSDEDTETETQD